MAQIILPIDSTEPYYDVDIELSGTLYNFVVRYNTRWEAWLLSINEADKTPICSNFPIVEGMPMFFTSNNPKLPPGAIIGIDTTGARQEATRDSLGDTFLMFYFEPGA